MGVPLVIHSMFGFSMKPSSELGVRPFLHMIWVLVWCCFTQYESTGWSLRCITKVIHSWGSPRGNAPSMDDILIEGFFRKNLEKSQDFSNQRYPKMRFSETLTFKLQEVAIWAMEEQWERPIADRASGWTLHGGAGASRSAVATRSGEALGRRPIHLLRRQHLRFLRKKQADLETVYIYIYI